MMTYLAPFTTTGILTITDEALTPRAEDHAATLQSTDLLTSAADRQLFEAQATCRSGPPASRTVL